jgi:hypothetical protein
MRVVILVAALLLWPPFLPANTRDGAGAQPEPRCTALKGGAYACLSGRSIYRLAMDPDTASAAVEAPLVRGLRWSAPKSLAPGSLLPWMLIQARIAWNRGPLVVTAVFNDGKIMATLDWQVASDHAGWQVTWHRDTAQDAWGNPVPNLLMPARINPPGVDFSFGEDDAPQGWRELMSSLGYRLEAGSGSHWRCSDRPLNQPSDARCWIAARVVPAQEQFQ